MAMKTKLIEILIFCTTNDDHRPFLGQRGNFKTNMNFWKAGKTVSRLVGTFVSVETETEI
jgi:hypothetical protein